MIRRYTRHRLPAPRRFEASDFIGAAFILAMICGALTWGS